MDPSHSWSTFCFLSHSYSGDETRWDVVQESAGPENSTDMRLSHRPIISIRRYIVHNLSETMLINWHWQHWEALKTLTLFTWSSHSVRASITHHPAWLLPLFPQTIFTHESNITQLALKYAKKILFGYIYVQYVCIYGSELVPVKSLILK